MKRKASLKKKRKAQKSGIRPNQKGVRIFLSLGLLIYFSSSVGEVFVKKLPLSFSLLFEGTFPLSFLKTLFHLFGGFWLCLLGLALAGPLRKRREIPLSFAHSFVLLFAFFLYLAVLIFSLFNFSFTSFKFSALFLACLFAGVFFFFSQREFEKFLSMTDEELRQEAKEEKAKQLVQREMKVK